MFEGIKRDASSSDGWNGLWRPPTRPKQAAHEGQARTVAGDVLREALHKDAALDVLPDQQVRRLWVQQVRDHLHSRCANDAIGA